MKKIALLFFVTVILSSCNHATKIDPKMNDNKKLATVFDNYYENRLQFIESQLFQEI